MKMSLGAGMVDVMPEGIHEVERAAGSPNRPIYFV
jgi:hypothetical protein